jgi:hypothetical protein
MGRIKYSPAQKIIVAPKTNAAMLPGAESHLLKYKNMRIMPIPAMDKASGKSKY